MEKQALKERMLALEEAELAHAREHYRDFVAGARLNHAEPVETADRVDAEAFGELAVAFDAPVHGHADKLAKLNEIDFTDKDIVEEGAIVRLDGRWFVIAVATTRFEFAGETLMGISTSAPIYAAIEGCRAGDRVAFGGRNLNVEMVL